ncbi:acyltransferase [Vibrio breoganii]
MLGIKIYTKMMKLINTLFCFFFIKGLKINPIYSHFHGRVWNDNGTIIIHNGFRNKFSLYISVCKGKLAIGENVFFNNDVSINVRKKVIIGNNVLLGEGVKIYDHDHDYRLGSKGWRKSFTSNPITIEKNVWVGANCIILQGAHIEEGSVIAAGSIVSKRVPRNSLYIQKRKIEIRDING